MLVCNRTGYALMLQKSSYSDFVCRITGGDRLNHGLEINFESHDQQGDSLSEFIIPLDALKLILLKALSWYFVHEQKGPRYH